MTWLKEGISNAGEIEAVMTKVRTVADIARQKKEAKEAQDRLAKASADNPESIRLTKMAELKKSLEEARVLELLEDGKRHLEGGEIVTRQGIYVGHSEASWRGWVAHALVLVHEKKVHSTLKRAHSLELTAITVGAYYRKSQPLEASRFYTAVEKGILTEQEEDISIMRRLLKRYIPNLGPRLSFSAQGIPLDEHTVEHVFEKGEYTPNMDPRSAPRVIESDMSGNAQDNTNKVKTLLIQSFRRIPGH